MKIKEGRNSVPYNCWDADDSKSFTLPTYFTRLIYHTVREVLLSLLDEIDALPSCAIKELQLPR